MRREGVSCRAHSVDFEEGNFNSSKVKCDRCRLVMEVMSGWQLFSSMLVKTRNPDLGGEGHAQFDVQEGRGI